MITNFRYNDIVLYSKGWYEKSGNIAEDLDIIFQKIYGYSDSDEKAIAHKMLMVLDRLYEEKNIKFDSNSHLHCFVGLYEEISRYMWLYDISRDMALIMVVLSILSQLSKDEIKLKAPHYGKKEPFRLGKMFGDKYPISMTYKEMNRIAEKTFGK